MWPRAINFSPIDLDRVDWRRRQLVNTGFAPATATALSESEVDIHVLIELVGAGCPPHLAARIMAPLDVELPR
jgi:hypothetical protein